MKRDITNLRFELIGRSFQGYKILYAHKLYSRDRFALELQDCQNIPTISLTTAIRIADGKPMLNVPDGAA
jgi:hypothetical protein